MACTHSKTLVRSLLPCLECPVCLKTFKDPKTLQCGHTICASCAKKMLGAKTSQVQMSIVLNGHVLQSPNDRQLKCPTCRQITSVPSTGLCINYAIKEAVEILEACRSDCAPKMTSSASIPTKKEQKEQKEVPKLTAVKRPANALLDATPMISAPRPMPTNAPRPARQAVQPMRAQNNVTPQIPPTQRRGPAIQIIMGLQQQQRQS